MEAIATKSGAQESAGARKLIRRMSFWACSAGMFLILPLMFMTTGDVISRSLFNKPVAGSFELSEYMLAVIILLGAAYTQQVKGHVWVDFFTVRFSPRTQAVFQVITGIGSVSIVTVLMVMGFLEAYEEKAVSDMLRIPQWPFKMLVFVGGLLLWLELLLDLFESLRQTARGGR